MNEAEWVALRRKARWQTIGRRVALTAAINTLAWSFALELFGRWIMGTFALLLAGGCYAYSLVSRPLVTITDEELRG